MKTLVLYHGTGVLFNSFSEEQYINPKHTQNVNTWGVRLFSNMEHAFAGTNKMPVHYEYYWEIDGKRVRHLDYELSQFTSCFYQKLNLKYKFSKHKDRNYRNDILKLLYAKKEKLSLVLSTTEQFRYAAFLSRNIFRLEKAKNVNLRRKSKRYLYEIGVEEAIVFDNQRQVPEVVIRSCNKILKKEEATFQILSTIDYKTPYETFYQYLLRKFKGTRTSTFTAARQTSQLLLKAGYDLIKTNLYPDEYLYIGNAKLEILNVNTI